ncbi:copper amine oxidase N-terminal domain-containing protein [Paenibacillus sp. BR2-3]|uniref:copper amine oxidase N-terminal domain-containing protein n=1 Tax=Paenibacillus sp. BR2-3 TaxID=3048494 RepID=UPI00397769FC
MKFIPGFLATLILSSTIGLTAFAAEQPITVLIDQQKLDLSSSAPVNDNGTILLPLRTVFVKLGLQVNYDAKTGSITGTKEGLIIKQQIGSKKASVNGIIKQLTSAPKVINQVTYVPLRFVGESTNSNVNWDAKRNTVTITTKQQTVDPKEISAFFDSYVAYSNKEDYDGFMSLIDPKSPLAQIGPQLKDQIEKFDLATSIEQLDIISLQPNEATVHTIETTHKIKGSFKLDDKAEYIYTLTKKEGEQNWKISNLQITAVQYILPEEMLKASVTVPKAEEEGISAVLQAHIKNSNEENLDGVLATLDATSPQFEQNKQIFSQIFKAYDLLFTVESSKIINYTENEAAVYMIQTTKKLKGPDFQDNRASSVTTLKKSKEGKWVIAETYLIKSDKLTP